MPKVSLSLSLSLFPSVEPYKTRRLQFTARAWHQFDTLQTCLHLPTMADVLAAAGTAMFDDVVMAQKVPSMACFNQIYCRSKYMLLIHINVAILRVAFLF